MVLAYCFPYSWFKKEPGKKRLGKKPQKHMITETGFFCNTILG